MVIQVMEDTEEVTVEALVSVEALVPVELLAIEVEVQLTVPFLAMVEMVTALSDLIPE